MHSGGRAADRLSTLTDYRRPVSTPEALDYAAIATRLFDMWDEILDAGTMTVISSKPYV